MAEKPWKGRFSKKIDPFIEEFTSSISFDKRLYKYDIMGSIAHAQMLGKQGILEEGEVNKIVHALEEIKEEMERGEFDFCVASEDIHMNIERRLMEKLGDLGGKLHTARSRNDQVVLDMRLYLRDMTLEILSQLTSLLHTLLAVSENNLGIIMPGYTHLQRAQPVLFSHHIMAYFEMFYRDGERYRDSLPRINCFPLGAGALAGTSLPVDRRYVAGILNFPAITKNSIDSVSDRDFLIEFCSASAILMMHLSRLSEELILWSTSEFDFIELSEAHCTGSSLMPQKKNPDVPELIRGKTGRVYGNLLSLLTMMKSLPLAYNKDMQEDKEALFDTVDTVKNCLKAINLVIKGMKVKKESMEEATKGGFSTSTDMVEYLVKKKVPFRQAHHIIGKIVKHCLEQKKELWELSLKELKQFSHYFEEDVYEYLTPKKSVESKRSLGGTSEEVVRKAIEERKAQREDFWKISKIYLSNAKYKISN